MNDTEIAPQLAPPGHLTRDGMVSVASRMEPSVVALRVTTAEALAWARTNRIALPDTQPLVAVNAAREKLGLPRFTVADDSTPRPSVAPRQEPVKESAEPSSPPIVASGEELIDLITTYSGMRTGVVTPEIAGWMLAINTINRNNVTRLADAIKAGRWKNTGHAIVVNREGSLNDGQHRLLAVQQSGIAVDMDVRFGIERAAFMVTDTGARRSAANVLAISGQPHATLVSAMARMLHHYDTNTMGMCGRPVENDIVQSVAEANPTLSEVAARISRSKFAPTRAAPYGFVLAVAARTAGMRVLEFHQLVESGLADEDNPARRLHVRLRDAAMAKERLRPIDVAVLTVRAWNAWSVGRTVQRLLIVEADRTSRGFPDVAP